MAERVEQVLLKFVLDMESNVKGLANAKAGIKGLADDVQKSLDTLRQSVQKGIDSNKIVDQTKQISSSFVGLSKAFGVADTDSKQRFVSLLNTIENFRNVYTKSLSDVSQQSIISSQTVVEAIARIDAANTRSTKGQKFTEIRDSLIQLREDINNNIDPSLLAKRLDEVITSAATLARQRKGELKIALEEAVVKPLSDLKTENIGRQLSNVIKDAFSEASKFAKLTIPPIELKDLQKDKLQTITTSFEAMGRVVKLVGTDISRWDATLKEAFKGDTAALQTFKAGMEHLLPVFTRLEKDSSSFGKLFNTSSREASDNLFILQKTLESIDAHLLGGANTLGPQIGAVRQLNGELQILRSAETGLKELDKAFITTTDRVNHLDVAVKALNNAFASGGKKSESFAGFAKTETSAKVLEQTIEHISQRLETLRQQATRSDGTSVFGNALQLQLDSALTKVAELSIKFQGLNGSIAKIRTDHIDSSLSQAAKAAENFSRSATENIERVRSGILSLGSTSLTSGISSSLSKMLNGLSQPIQLVTDLKNVYSNFVSTVKGNIANVSITGVKESITDFGSLIRTVQQYVNSVYAVEKANLDAATAAGKVDATQAKAVDTWQKAVESLNVLNADLSKNSKEISDQASIYKLYSDAIATALNEATQATTRYQTATQNSGTSIETIVKEFNIFDETMVRTDKTLESSAKKLAELARAGAALPKQLIGDNFFGSFKINSIQDIVAGIGQIRTGFASTQSTIAGTAANAQTLDAEYRKLAGAVGALSIPQSAIEAAIQYDLQLQNVIKSFGQASKSVSDFSTLQTVYSEHKRGLQTLYESIQKVIKAEQKMGTSSVNLASLEQVRRQITAQTAAITIGLQSGGASLDTLVQKTGRLQEAQNKFNQLASSVTQLEQKLAGLAKSGASADVLKDLRSEVTRLIAERQHLMTEVGAAKAQLDNALNTAIRTVGSGGDLSQLQQSVKTAEIAFNQLEQSIKKVPATVETLGAQMRNLESSSAPVNRLATAIQQADRALQGTKSATTSFASSFDQQVQILVNDLVKVSGQIGIVRTSFEQRPREVLQSFMSDLRIKADELARSYIEITKSIHVAESAAQAGINVNSTSLTDAKERAEGLRNEMERVRQAVGTLQEVMTRLPVGSNALKGFGDIASSMSEVNDKASFLSRGMRSLFDLMLRQNASRLGMNFDELKQRTDGVTASLRQFENQLVGSVRNMDMMVMGAQMLGQALISPFKQGLESFSKVEDTLTFIQGATEETTAAINTLGKTTQTVGSTSRYGVEQVADGFKQLALAGYTVNEQIQTLPTVLQLATAAETGLAAATEIVVQIMSSQRLAISEIGKATDVMSMAAIRTTATLADMGVAFRYVGSIAGTMKNDIEDTAGAVALLHNAGMRGSLAGTALRGAFQALLNPTRDEAKVLEELSRRIGGVGLQITDASGKFVGFVQLLKQFERAGLQTNEVLNLFGQRAGPGMAALLQLGSDKLEELVDDLRGAEGSTAQLATMMEKTLAGRFQILSNSLSVMGESIGHSLSISLKPIVAFTTDVVNGVNAVREAMGPLTPIIDTVAASLAGLLVVVGGGALIWAMMLVPTTKLLVVLKTIIVTLTGTAKAIIALATVTAPAAVANTAYATSLDAVWAKSIAAGGGIRGLMVALRALSIAMITTPWGLFITAMLAVGAAAIFLVRNTETTNAALDRQIAIAASSSKAFSNLGNKIEDVGKKLQVLSNQSFADDASSFLNLPNAQSQVSRFQNLLDQLVIRYNESGDQIKKGLQLEKSFDPITGQLNGLKIISTETGQVISDLSTKMLSSKTVALDLANATKALNAEVGKLANRDAANAAEEKFINQLHDHLSVLRDVSYATKNGSQQQASVLQENYDKLIGVKKDYVAAEAALDRAKESQDQKAIDAATENLTRLQNQLYKMYQGNSLMGGGSIARPDMEALEKNLDKSIESIFSRISKIKEDAAKFNQTVGKIVNDAIANIKINKGSVDVDSVIKTITDDLDSASPPHWMPEFMQGMFSVSSADKEAIITKVRQSFNEMTAEISSQAQRINAEATLDTQFAALQRVTNTMLKAAETQVKELGSKMEDMSKLMSTYKDNAEAFIKYRDQINQSAKAKLDTGISSIQQETNVALTQIKASYDTAKMVADGAFSDMSKAAIGWGKSFDAVNTKAFDSFASYQGQQKDVAKQTADASYSYYRNSLEKQIDDLTRESANVTSHEYTIPIRLEAEQSGFNTYVNGILTETEGAVREFVVGAKKETELFLQYSLTFDKKLFDSKVQLESERFRITKEGLDKEKAEVTKHYNSILPMYKEGSADRIKQEQEFATKKKELDLRGVQSTQAALDNIKEMYKSNADKIKQIETDRVNFIARINAKRDDIENSGLNDVQKFEKERNKIIDLNRQAELAKMSGDWDKAAALYEKSMTAIEGLNFEPWDNSAKQFVNGALNSVETGMLDVNDQMKRAGESQQKTLEQTAKGLEDVLSAFQKNLGQVETDLKKLAESLVEIQKFQANEDLGLNFDDNGMLEKLNSIVAAKEQIDRQFEKPVEIKISGAEAVQEILKLGQEQRQMQQSRNQAAGDQRELEQMQLKLDKTNQLRALYQDISDMMSRISQTQLPDGVELGASLKDVSKDGSDGQEALQKLVQTLDEYGRQLNTILDTYSKTDLAAPQALYDELQRIKEAKDSLKVDSKDSVLIDSSVVDVLSVNVDRLETFKTALQTVDDTKIKALSSSFSELGTQLAAISKRTDDLKDERIGGAARAQAPVQQWNEVRNILEKTVPALKEVNADVSVIENTLTSAGHTAQEAVKQINQVGTEAIKPIPPVQVPVQVKADSVVADSRQAAVAAQDAVSQVVKPVEIQTSVQPVDVQDTQQMVMDTQELLPPVEVQTEVTPPNVQTSVDALQKVRNELESLQQLQDLSSRASIKLFTPEQLQNLESAKTYVDGLLSSVNQGQVRVDVNQDSINSIINTLNEVKQQANATFDGFGKGVGEGQLKDQLDALIQQRDELAKTKDSDLVDLGNFNKNTNTIMAMKTAFEQLNVVRQSASDVPVFSPTAEQSLSVMSTKLGAFEQQLAQARSSELGLYINPNIEAKLKDLQDQVATFQQTATEGRSLDTTALDDFKTKMTQFAKDVEQQPVEFNFSDLNAAYSEVENLKKSMADVPRTMPLTTDDKEIQSSIDYLKELVGYDGKKVAIDVIANLTKQSRTVSGFNAGGLVQALQMFAKGGLATIRKFADGGSVAFNRLRSAVVPGTGNKDTVPAALTPGEFIIRKSMVSKYGLKFLHALNSGVLQFRALGGLINDLPNTTMAGLGSYLLPNTNSNLNSIDGGPYVDVRLHIGNEVATMKSSRDQIKILAAAAKQLQR